MLCTELIVIGPIGTERHGQMSRLKVVVTCFIYRQLHAVCSVLLRHVKFFDSITDDTTICIYSSIERHIKSSSSERQSRNLFSICLLDSIQSKIVE